MITTYNKYVNKEILLEKVELNINQFVKKIKEETTRSKSAVVYSTITADGEPVIIDGEYYALFYTTVPVPSNINKSGVDQPKGDPFYTIGIVKITGEKTKTLMGTDRETTVYTFKLLKITNILTDRTKLSDYTLYKSEKAKVKFDSDEVNGFYLYKEEKTGGDVKSILKRYGLAGKDVQVSDPNEIEVGSVYEITNSKGNRVKVAIFNITNGEITGRDFENKIDYNNTKVKNIIDPKYINTLFDVFNSKQEELEKKNWKKSEEFTKLNSEEKIKFIQEKIDNLNKIMMYTEASMNSRNKENNISLDVKEDIKSLRKSVSEKIKRFNDTMTAINNETAKKSKPVEEVEDTTATPEEQVQRDATDEMDKTAQKLQTKAQGEKELKAKKKVVKKPIKQQKTITEPQPEKAQLAPVAENYKKFIDEKNKKL